MTRILLYTVCLLGCQRFRDVHEEVAGDKTVVVMGMVTVEMKPRPLESDR